LEGAAAGSWLIVEAELTGAGKECRPTMYPIVKKSPNRTTTMKKPLSNWRLPSTSSNSPSSFFAINEL
jgi:hypothetical protein